LYVSKSTSDVILTKDDLIRTDFEQTTTSKSDWGVFTTCAATTDSLSLSLSLEDEVEDYVSETDDDIHILTSNADIPSSL